MTNRILAILMVLIVIVGSTVISTDRDAHGLVNQNDATPGVGADATPQSGASGDVSIGDMVVFAGDEGDALATITVVEVIYPYNGFATSFTPAENSVYIAIGITIENLDPDDDTFQFLTFYCGIQTADGFYYTPGFVSLDEEGTNTYPLLGNDPIAANASASGYLFFAIPADKVATRLFYSPAGRLLLLAELPAAEREAPSA